MPKTLPHPITVAEKLMMNDSFFDRIKELCEGQVDSSNAKGFVERLNSLREQVEESLYENSEEGLDGGDVA